VFYPLHTHSRVLLFLSRVIVLVTEVQPPYGLVHTQENSKTMKFCALFFFWLGEFLLFGTPVRSRYGTEVEFASEEQQSNTQMYGRGLWLPFQFQVDKTQSTVAPYRLRDQGECVYRHVSCLAAKKLTP
jgi:hypothetical protein